MNPPPLLTYSLDLLSKPTQTMQTTQTIQMMLTPLQPAVAG